MRDASLLTAAIGELSTAEVRTLLARTERSTAGRGAELRPRLREAVRAGDLAPEDVLRRLDEDTLEALLVFSGHERPRSLKHAELLGKLAGLILSEEQAPRPRKKSKARSNDDRPTDELELLRDDLDRLLDERARLEAKNQSLRREVDRLRDEAAPVRGLKNVPDDLGELLREIGLGEMGTFKGMYRAAAKLLHPDKNKEGELAFRLLTRIRDLVEGRE